MAKRITAEVRVARAFAKAHDIDRMCPPEPGYPTRTEIKERIELAMTRELLDAAAKTKMLEIKTVALRPHGTYSVLLWDGDPFAVSVEVAPPILANGPYHAHRDFYHAGNYETFEIDVWGHDRVLFHKGNHGSDSKACVIVAESFAWLAESLKGVPGATVGVADSRHGFEEFMALTKGLLDFDIVVSGR